MIDFSNMRGPRGGAVLRGRAAVLALLLAAASGAAVGQAPPDKLAADKATEKPDEKPQTAQNTTAAPSRGIAIDVMHKISADYSIDTTSTSSVRIATTAQLKDVASRLAAMDAATRGNRPLVMVERANGDMAEMHRLIQFAPDPGNFAVDDGVKGPRLDAPAVLDVDMLQVGDRVSIVTWRKGTSGPFPNSVIVSGVFAPWSEVAAASVTVDAPKAVQLFGSTDGPAITYAATNDGDRVLHRVTFEAPWLPQKREAGGVEAGARLASYAIGSFKDHGAFAQAYVKSLGRPGDGGEALARLTRDIAYGLPTPALQAEAIDIWIKRNVATLPTSFVEDGQRPVVIEAILRERRATARGHAVLAEAMLAVIGLEAEHVLVDTGSRYGPTLAPDSVSHVLLFVPKLSRYIDTTQAFAALGVLSATTYDKPALRIGAGTVTQTRIPPMAPDAHTSTSKTKVTIAADGIVRGETLQTATGVFAAAARLALLRPLMSGGAIATASAPQKASKSKEPEESQDAAMARAFLRRLSTPGTGAMKADSSSAARDPFRVTSTFRLDTKIAQPMRGNIAIPAGLPVLARPGSWLLGQRLEGRSAPFACLAGTQSEEIAITFHEDLNMPKKPVARDVTTSVFTYKATVDMKGRTITIKRDFVSKVPGQACPPELERELSEPMRLVGANMASYFVFGGNNQSSGEPGITAPTKSGN